VNLVNLIIAMAVAVLMFVGAGMTYQYRMLEAEHPAEVAMVSPGQFVKNVAALHASLPKWDDKNWKGLNHHLAGYYKKKAEADKQAASKQTAAR
jgi:hypothetical protein